MKFSFFNNDIREVGRGITPVLLEVGERTYIKTDGDREVLVIGVKDFKEINRRKFILLCRNVVKTAKQYKFEKIAVQFNKTPFPQLKKLKDDEIVSIMAQNFELANYAFTKFRTKPKDGWPEITEVIFCGKTTAREKKAIEEGRIIGEQVNDCRELANTPGGDMTPKLMTKAAQRAVKGTSIKVVVLGKKELTQKKMGAVLGVAKGSIEEPQFIIMEYWGAGKPKQQKRNKGHRESGRARGADKHDPIVLVGKGVTFDTGGINLKPSDSSLGMHMDMSGGAAVIYAIVLAAKLNLKKNIVALIPAVENMPSGESYRPGDVLTSLSGKTIEVMNTDAEGRVILADALTYARTYDPRLVVDVATLTGAALVALGQRASVILTKDQKLEDLFRKLGEESGDYVWPLPLWEEYESEVKGKRGDVTNTHHKGSRYGGAINGAIFLHEFARGMPWVHIDMAPRMESIPDDNLEQGATGEPVRLLLRLLQVY